MEPDHAYHHVYSLFQRLAGTHGWTRASYQQAVADGLITAERPQPLPLPTPTQTPAQTATPASVRPASTPAASVAKSSPSPSVRKQQQLTSPFSPPPPRRIMITGRSTRRKQRVFEEDDEQTYASSTNDADLQALSHAMEEAALQDENGAIPQAVLNLASPGPVLRDISNSSMRGRLSFSEALSTPEVAPKPHAHHPSSPLDACTEDQSAENSFDGEPEIEEAGEDNEIQNEIEEEEEQEEDELPIRKSKSHKKRIVLSDDDEETADADFAPIDSPRQDADDDTPPDVPPMDDSDEAVILDDVNDSNGGDEDDEALPTRTKKKQKRIVVSSSDDESAVEDEEEEEAHSHIDDAESASEHATTMSEDDEEDEETIGDEDDEKEDIRLSRSTKKKRIVISDDEEETGVDDFEAIPEEAEEASDEEEDEAEAEEEEEDEDAEDISDADSGSESSDDEDEYCVTESESDDDSKRRLKKLSKRLPPARAVVTSPVAPLRTPKQPKATPSRKPAPASTGGKKKKGAVDRDAEYDSDDMDFIATSEDEDGDDSESDDSDNSFASDEDDDGEEGGRKTVAKGKTKVKAQPPVKTMSLASFRRQRAALLESAYEEFNRVIFGNRLPPSSEFKLEWSKTLRTTGGICSSSADCRLVKIQLSEKVCDDEIKMRETLVHEMCHAAVTVVDRNYKGGHGADFKRWGRHVTRTMPSLGVIDRCHSYQIHFAHRYQCTNEWCKMIYGRHSDSLNVKKKACGRCRGRLVHLGRFNADGTPAKVRTATGFALYVKTNYSAAKLQNPTTPHRDLMKVIAANYQSAKKDSASVGASKSVSDEQADLEQQMGQLAFDDEDGDEQGAMAFASP